MPTVFTSCGCWDLLSRDSCKVPNDIKDTPTGLVVQGFRAQDLGLGVPEHGLFAANEASNNRLLLIPNLAIAVKLEQLAAG